jgi:hypothetical protein
MTTASAFFLDAERERWNTRFIAGIVAQPAALVAPPAPRASPCPRGAFLPLRFHDHGHSLMVRLQGEDQEARGLLPHRSPSPRRARGVASPTLERPSAQACEVARLRERVSKASRAVALHEERYRDVLNEVLWSGSGTGAPDWRARAALLQAKEALTSATAKYIAAGGMLKPDDPGFAFTLGVSRGGVEVSADADRARFATGGDAGDQLLGASTAKLTPRTLTSTTVAERLAALDQAATRQLQRSGKVAPPDWLWH